MSSRLPFTRKWPTDKLPGLLSAVCKPEPVNHVIQPAFKKLKEVVACLPGHFVGYFEYSVELRLVHSVKPAELLLLPEADSVLLARPGRPFDLALVADSLW